MVHNKYVHTGVFWTSADPPPRRLSRPPWPPQLHWSRTATDDYIRLQRALKVS